MSNEARIKLNLEGDEAAIRKFLNVGAASKKAGDDISNAFVAAGKAVANFGAAALDAVIDVKGLNPAEMVRTWEDYARAVTRTSVATGQSIDAIRGRYQELSRLNAVMPQQIDSFAKSVGRMTYDIRGAAEAFTGMHEAALAFGETDQEQVPFAVMLKNVQGVAGDTTQAVGKLFAQANKLGTVGGARALRDLFVDLAPVIDATVSKLGNGVAKAQAFVGVLTAGLKKNQATRVGSAALGFLESQGLALWKQFGENPYDDQGHIKDPAKWYRRILAHDLKSVEHGGRGMTPQMVQMALFQDLGPEAGAAVWKQMVASSGFESRVAAVQNVAPINTAQKAGIAYRSSQIGRVEAGYVGQFEATSPLAETLFDAKADASKWVAENPFLALGAAWAAKTIIGKALPGLGAAAAGAGAGTLGLAGASLFMSGDYKPSDTEELAQQIYDEQHGHEPILGYFESTKKRIEAGKTVIQNQGGNPATMSPAELETALKRALESVTIKTQPADAAATTASQAESDKNLNSRN